MRISFVLSSLVAVLPAGFSSAQTVGQGGLHGVESATPWTYTGRGPGDARQTGPAVPLASVLAEELRNNPEIRAAENERTAVQHRVTRAAALDDPMFETGVLNLPTNSFNFSQEEMTMKMLGVSQRFPYPGKRALRKDIAQQEAESIAYGYQETINRVARDAKIAYCDLALVIGSMSLVEQNRSILVQLLKVAENRYAVGQGTQVDVLRAQSQVSKMTEELIRLEREERTLQAELNRLIGRAPGAAPPLPVPLALDEAPLRLTELESKALGNRPQLLGLLAMIRRGEKMGELAHKETYPDFDVRLSYGLRENMPDGTKRSDMVSLTVGMNLPIWRETKNVPRMAESRAFHDQAINLYEAQKNETAMKLRQQIARAEESVRAARLYRSEIVPQSRLTVEAAVAAYQVNRTEFALLLDNQMAIFNFQVAHATVVASHNKALAEIELLTGEIAQGAQRTSEEPPEAGGLKP
jgi:outer membrane protein TolC